MRYFFAKRGAYQKFKALLTKRNMLERWYDLESRSIKRALREWCEVNEIEVTD